MNVVQAFGLSLVAVVAIDWIFVSRLAGFFSDFEYRFWPPRWPRVVSLVVAVATTAVSALMFTPGDMPAWPLLVWVIVFGLWMIIAVDDIARQRQLGFKKPARYSEKDD